MRKLFRQNRYKVFLVDEHKTSCMCSNCKDDKARCETFTTKKNPKPYKEGNIPVHGLLKCKICSKLWNRDVNSATNIYRIAKNAITKEERPKYLCREKKEETNKEKQKPKKGKKVVIKKKIS